MVEHSAVNRRVTGSSPVCPARVATTQRKCCGWFWSAFHQYINKSALVRGIGVMAAAADLGSAVIKACGFESHVPHHCWFYYFINVRSGRTPFKSLESGWPRGEIDKNNLRR